MIRVEVFEIRPKNINYSKSTFRFDDLMNGQTS